MEAGKVVSKVWNFCMLVCTNVQNMFQMFKLFVPHCQALEVIIVSKLQEITETDKINMPFYNTELRVHNHGFMKYYDKLTACSLCLPEIVFDLLTLCISSVCSTLNKLNIMVFNQLFWLIFILSNKRERLQIWNITLFQTLYIKIFLLSFRAKRLQVQFFCEPETSWHT